MIKPEDSVDRGGDEGPPPIGGSWRNLYLLVIVNLALLVALFYTFTKAFS